MSNIGDLQVALMQLLESIGKYDVEQKKESMHIVRERAFLGIHPKKSYLGVNVVLDHSKASPSASKVEQVSANRFYHFYKITDKQELDRSFARLLKEAFDLAQPKK
jgi:hypothetical protein